MSNSIEDYRKTMENYVSPYEKEMLARLDSLDELGLMKTFLLLLNKTEESDSGRVFRPNYISSCRTLDSLEMGEIMKRLNKKLGIEE